MNGRSPATSRLSAATRIDQLRAATEVERLRRLLSTPNSQPRSFEHPQAIESLTVIPALSFVIPLYNSAATIGALVADIETLQIDGGHELILVNDGSADATAAVCRDLVRRARIPIVYVEHSRNFGEHNAVLT